VKTAGGQDEPCTQNTQSSSNKNADDFDIIQESDRVHFPDVLERIKRGDVEIPVEIGEKKMITLLEVSERQRFYLLAGAALNYVRESLKK